jgi:hypothetical protein
MRKHRNQIGKPDSVEQARLRDIQSRYPKELTAIGDLHPFKKQDRKYKNKTENDKLPDHITLEIADIVTTYKRRFSDNGRYFTQIDECIRFADIAARNLESIVDRLGKLDGTHIEALWTVVGEVDPNGFAQREYTELLGQLSSVIHAMKVLTAALPLATGVSGKKQGRGRPPKPYFEAAGEMIRLWESITAEPKAPPYNPDIFWISLTPTAKKRVNKDEPDIVASQQSTEFCRLVFRMIDPNITLPQVRTAINKARKVREMWWQVLDGESGSSSKERVALRFGRYLQERSLKERKGQVKK